MSRMDKMRCVRNVLSKARVLFIGLEIVGLIGLMAAGPGYQPETEWLFFASACVIYAGLLGILVWAIADLVYQWRTDRAKVIADAKKTADWLGKAKWTFSGMILAGGVGSAIPYIQENLAGVHAACRLLLEIGWLGMAVWLFMRGVSRGLDRKWGG